MKVFIRREKPQPLQDCNLGFLLIPEKSFSLVTLELPWIPSPTCAGGTKGKSCVPPGMYQLVRHNSPKHPKTWALVNLDLDVVHYEGDDHDPDEDRATCLIHVANYPRQLLGCIGVGTRTAKAPPGEASEFMISESAKAMDLLRAVLPWTDEHILEISEAA